MCVPAKEGGTTVDRSLATRSPHTSADWWVIADQARHAAQSGLADAATAPDLLRTLTELERARRESGVAVGAAVEGLLEGGVAWEAITAALGHGSAEEARRALAAARQDAGAALERRLGRRT